MATSQQYAPGAAFGAEVRKDGEKWTLVLVRELRHPPARVWQALTDPAHLSEWAPFDADRNLAAVGPVKLSTVGTPTPQVSGGWQRLNAEYAKQFRVEAHGGPPNAPKP